MEQVNKVGKLKHFLEKAKLFVAMQAEGLSLVEVMMALFILLFSLMAMMQTALVAIDTNTRNVLRDEGVSVADGIIANVRSQAYVDIVDDTFQITRTVRNVDGGVVYNAVVNETVLDPGTDTNKQVVVTVDWSWRGQNFNHSLMTIVKK